MPKHSSRWQIDGRLIWLAAALIAAYGLSLTIIHRGIGLPFQLYLVQSGSMAPAIMTGDIVVVKKSAVYHKGETITFYDQNHRVITHRIIKQFDQNQRSNFVTKGDANETSDRQTVSQPKVIGKVVLILPKLGFLVAFAKTRYGALLLIIVPAVIIIYDEFRLMELE